MILILTGPTRSRKTSTLLQWAKVRNDCGGILCPDKRGLRYLLNVKDKKTFPFQKKEKAGSDDITVGNFILDGNGFKQASAWLDEHLRDPNLHYVVLDEIGLLELEGRGWDPWLKSSISKLGDKTLILVVRRKLLDEVIQRYGLGEVSVVEPDYFLPEGSEPLHDEIGLEDDAV
jgi:nucleoside-triphosphatase THEP1